MVDYSEYLGKDYVYKFDGVGVVVPNHICSLDLLFEVILDAPINCLLGKAEAKNIPFLKWMIDDQWLILVGRDQKDSKEVRLQVLDKIGKRAIEAEKGLKTPMLMFPEGCTTNGNYVISFKRGAFYALRSVQPVAAKIWSVGPFKPVSGDVGSLLSWILLLPEALIWGYTRDVMPTFTTNEYFWQHHWDGKEEKWVAYARAIQKIIAKQGGMIASDHTME